MCHTIGFSANWCMLVPWYYEVIACKSTVYEVIWEMSANIAT